MTSTRDFESDDDQTIVVGLDESESSGHAAAYAIEMARRTGAQLIFVQVLNTAMLLALAPDLLATARTAAEESAAQMRGRIAERLRGVDISWEVREFSGNPYLELTGVAAHEKNVTIVVGASRRGGYRLVGSLPSHLVKNH